MKIIGKTSEGYIIDVSNSEAIKLAGERYSVNAVSKDGQNKERSYDGLLSGDIIDVGELYNHAREVMSNWEDINKLISKLKSTSTSFQNSVKKYTGLQIKE